MKNLLNCRGRLIDFSTPKVMGILNITPDSFYDGGKNSSSESIITLAVHMIEDGADIIDIGGQSTRPGAKMITEEEEWKRLKEPLRKIRDGFPNQLISVDTFYSSVAYNAIQEGVDIINDISGGAIDEKMFQTIAKLKVPYVLTHIQGTPQNMQNNPAYDNVGKDVIKYFSEKINQLTLFGVSDIIIDPGFGFGKTTEHNYKLLNELELFRIFERPVLCGFSRKGMIQKVLNTSAEKSLNGTTVLNTIALLKGVNIFRVHDVKEAVEVITIGKKL